MNKQIEEMAKILKEEQIKIQNNFEEFIKFLDKDIEYCYAEALYNEGYRRNKDNMIAVQFVIPDEKLEKIKNECLEGVEYNIHEISKKAVKDFADRYKEHVKSFTGEFTDNGFMVSLNAVLTAVDFIEEQFSVEVE